MPATKEAQFENELFDAIESTQTMVVHSLKTLTDRVAEFRPEDLPEPKEVWSKSFDFADKVLENQRKFCLALMDAMTPEEKEAA